MTIYFSAQATGDLPGDCDPGDLARFITTLTDGIAVQAAAGADRDQLRRIVETALRAWPPRNGHPEACP